MQSIQENRSTFTIKKIQKLGINQKYQIIVSSSQNNLFLSLSDLKGNILYKTTCGENNFKGSTRSTPMAILTTIKAFNEKIKNVGIEKIDVLSIKINDKKRKQILKEILSESIFHKNTLIIDKAQVPHNGSRLKKKRRL